MYLIGIDGGGTKTKGYISDLEGNVLASAIGGSSNYLSAGRTTAKESLEQVINSLCNKININKEQTEIISLGLAGAGRKEDKKIIEEIIREIGINNKIIINNDAYISLVGAHGQEKGIITISGTGSISLGIDGNGKLHRTGGWGHILGDEGSGYYFGKEALIAIMKAYDGRGEGTTIRDKILDYLGFNSEEKIPKYVYNNIEEKNKIAKLAPLVVEAASEGDKIAKEIVNRGIVDLIDLTNTNYNKMGESVNIALAGGIFEKSKFVRENFIKGLKSKNPQCNVVENKFNSGIGALILAWNYKEIQYRDNKILKQIKDVDNNVKNGSD
ncbi:MAG: hypothetical protein GX968_06075 [Tissierellia bacterium]|nr:hypothetical protein [Tissierellia bacterium]